MHRERSVVSLVKAALLATALLAGVAGFDPGAFNTVLALGMHPGGETMVGQALAQSQGPNFGTESIGQVEISLSATGGDGTYAWSIIAGSLPPGVALRTDPGMFFPPEATRTAGFSVSIYPGFTDDPLAAGPTVVKAVHITELRSRINAVRAGHGLGAYPYTDLTLTLGTTAIRSVHITDLRTALSEAYVAAVLTPPGYTDPSLAAGAPIKAVHITEIRAAVVAIE